MRYVRLPATSLICAMLLAATLSPGLARASDVVLEAGKARGQGSLLRWNSECLIVTPRHVVWDEEFGMATSEPIRVTYADRTDTQATVFHTFAEDVALLRLAEQPRSGCHDERFESRDLDKLLQASGQALLKRREVDGSDVFTEVSVTSFDAFDSIRVEPVSATKSIDQGHSGSVLYLENRPAGMLTNVVGGVGVVMRADKLVNTIGPFLDASRRDASLFLSLDADSAFLETELSRQARREGITLAGEQGAASLQLLMTSEETRLESDTGNVVRYTTRIEIVDALDNLVMEERIEASGNSFVSIDVAADNAREDLANRLGEAGLLERLP